MFDLTTSGLARDCTGKVAYQAMLGIGTRKLDENDWKKALLEAIAVYEQDKLLLENDEFEFVEEAEDEDRNEDEGEDKEKEEEEKDDNANGELKDEL